MLYFKNVRATFQIQICDGRLMCRDINTACAAAAAAAAADHINTAFDMSEMYISCLSSCDKGMRGFISSMIGVVAATRQETATDHSPAAEQLTTQIEMCHFHGCAMSPPHHVAPLSNLREIFASQVNHNKYFIL